MRDSLQDSVKDFFEGVQKVRPPAETCEMVLNALREHDTPILERYTLREHSSGLPFYDVDATPEFGRLVGRVSTSGKGHTTSQALASGLMELVERYSCFTYLRAETDCVFTPERELSEAHLSYDDLRPCFMDDYAMRIASREEMASAAVTWYPARTIAGESVLMPMRFIGHVLQGTNGMAAGNTIEEALLQGLLEVIERHCITLMRARNDPTPCVVAETIESPLCREMVDRLVSMYEDVTVRDLSQGMRLPVIAVTRRVPSGHIRLTAGVATTKDEALLRALTENTQGDGYQQNFARDVVAAQLEKHPSVEYGDIDDIDDLNIRVEIERVADMLDRTGMSVVWTDATHPDLGIPAVIVRVMGAKLLLDQFLGEQRCMNTVFSAFASDAVAARRRPDALDHIGRGERRDPVNRALFGFLRGLLETHTGDMEQAEAAFADAARRDDSERAPIERARLRRDLLVWRGHCLETLDRADEAIDLYAAAVLADPGLRFADLVPPVGPEADRLFNEVKSLRVFTGIDTEAELAARCREFRARRRALEDLFATGEAALAEGRLTEAEQAALDARELDPEGARLLHLDWLVARTLARQGRFAEAADAVRRELAMSPGDPQFNLLLATCARRLDDADMYKAAIEAAFSGLEARAVAGSPSA